MRAGVRIHYHHGGFLAICLVFLSCTRSADEIPLLPPPTHPLSRSLIGYGVISASYTHVVDIPDPRGLSLGYLRRGSVVPVLERKYINNQGTTESWVLVDGNYRGWLREREIDIYDNKAQAQTAAEFLTE
ncbi:MAG: hypothetical protein LBT93_09270 [Treponema sp.]|nr:hypothetical protein [Treponema sp.]